MMVQCMCIFQEGTATSIGEQPVKMLVSSAAGARLTVLEALANLVAAPLTSLKVSQQTFHFNIFPIITLFLQYSTVVLYLTYLAPPSDVILSLVKLTFKYIL